MSLKDSRELAAKHGWTEIDHQLNIFMVSFTRGADRINIYYSRMTVATVVNHPRWGRNQMFRKHVWGEALEAIFENPRAHLNSQGIPGYHKDGRHISAIKRKRKHK